MATKRRHASDASKATPARRAALALTRAVREQNAYLSGLAPQVFSRFQLEASDRAFAHLLAQGVVSLQTTLDAVIDEVLRSPRDIKDDVRDVLRIAAYEILYLGKEAHAAVDQGVELVRQVAPRATGVANFVLHRIVEERPRFPYGDPACSLEAATLYYGFPAWLARAIEKDIGTNNALVLMRGSLQAAPVWFTPNACRMTSGELLRFLEATKIEFNTCESLIALDSPDQAAIFQFVDRGNVGDPAFLTLLEEDKVVVSDLSAQSITLLAASLVPRTNARVLEIGAGRGTKTLQLQSLCAERGVSFEAYEVVDVKPRKIEQLEARIERAGGTITQALVHDATTPFPQEPGTFDLVFIDAPCTGVGTLRRHPEIKARLGEEDSASLARIGQAMLEQACALVKPEGSLLYSTCTIFKEENEQVIERFLGSSAGAVFETVAIGADGTAFFNTPITPHGPDLHFAALLRRKA